MLTRICDSLATLVAFQTVSDRSNLACLDWIANRLDGWANIQVLPHPTEPKASLLARIGPPVPGGVVLSAHLDVVSPEGQPWATDPFVLTERDGRLYGRGTCDMKGFVAAALTCAEKLKGQHLNRPLWLAFTYDEEIGCLAAPVLVDALTAERLPPAAVIVGEPSDMMPVAVHKGVSVMRLEVTGRAAHSSSPQYGASAILPVTRFVGWLEQYFEHRRTHGPFAAALQPPHSTFNAGVIVGGKAMNIVPDTCRLDWEFREIPGDNADAIYNDVARYVENELLPALQNVHPEACAELTRFVHVPSLAREPNGVAERLACWLTEHEALGYVPFGTEGGIFQSAGYSTIVCGPGNVAQAHQADEFVTIDQLKRTSVFMERLGRMLMNDYGGMEFEWK